MKRMIALLLIIMLLCLICACGSKQQEQNAEDNETISEDVTVNLYFGCSAEGYLTAEQRTFTLAKNASLEEATVGALIGGPQSATSGLISLFPAGTSLVSVSDEEDCLIVVLSKEFLNSSNEASMRPLSIYSIADTVIELGTYSRVLVMVDEDGSGHGARITNGQAGFDKNEDVLMEPVAHNDAVILSAENTVREILGAYKQSDFEKTYSFLADDDQRPDEETFISVVSGNSITIIQFSILGTQVSPDGSEAVVFVTIYAADGVNRTNVPIKLIRQNWRYMMPISIFERTFKYD